MEMHPTGSAQAPRAQPAIGADTKIRLLDAAERLFTEHGFEGTSMRAVTQAADASVSAANYHFGSKEELLRAVLRRRVEPVNRRRLDRLSELESGVRAPRVEEVLDAFLRPLLDVHAERIAGVDRRDYYRQVAARLFADPPEKVSLLRRELFAHVNERFVAALCRALPGCAEEDVDLALQLTVGVMVHVIGGQLDGGTEEGFPRHEPVLRNMIAFASAGIRAVAAAGSSERSRSVERGRR